MKIVYVKLKNSFHLMGRAILLTHGNLQTEFEYENRKPV